MRIEETELPEFVIAFRGYDRTQVDDYIGQLRHYAGEMENRSRSAEAQLTVASGELVRARHQIAEAPRVELAPRLGQILALASEEAEDIRRQARDEAAATRREALQAAEDAARGCRDEILLMLDEAAERRQRIEREIEGLDSTRRTLLDHLAGLADELRNAIAAHTAGVVALVGPVGADAAAPGTDSGGPSQDDDRPTVYNDEPTDADPASPNGADGPETGPPTSTRAVDGPTTSFPAPNTRMRLPGSAAPNESQDGTPLPWAENS